VTTTASFTDTERQHVKLPAEPTPEALAVAEMLLDRSSLRLRKATPDRTRQALARVLDAYPPSSLHSALLVASLRRRTPAESKRGPRPDREQAVRRLLAAGQLPTPGAVAGELRNLKVRRDAETAREIRCAPLLERDGPTIAGAVRDLRRRTGSDPTRSEVRHYMRHKWRYTDGGYILRMLVELGWLAAGRDPGTLKPGPRSRGLAW